MSPEESSDFSEKYRLTNRPTADVRLHISCYAFAQHLLCRRRTTDVQQHSNHILKSAPRRRPENSQGCGSLTCEL